MTDEIKARLKEASDNCQKAYDEWDAKDKGSQSRETLQDAIHELRKVASRLEIELAISERDQMAQRPIPIPPHRDSKNRGNNGGDQDDNIGNGDAPQRKQQRRRSPAKKSSGNNG